MFIQAALIAAQMWLGEITRQRPKKIGFEEFKQNNLGSELRPIPYIAGTVEIVPQRIWFGDYKQRAVERDSHWTDFLWAAPFQFLLDVITVGYRYYCAEVFALSYGPDVHIERIIENERLMFAATPGTDNAGGGFLLDDPEAWGGDQPPGEGGRYAWVDITRGNYTDSTNAYLESQLTTPPNRTPSLRGVSALIVRGPSGFEESGYFAAGGIGFIPKLKEWKITCRRQPNNLATGFHKMGRHANPMEVFYEHATSQEFGARCPVDEINIASLQSVAQTLYEESNGDFTSGWSGQIENPTSPSEVCKNILAQIDGVMDFSPSLGLTIRLIRRDYVFGSLPLLNQSNVTAVERYDPGTYEDTVNKVIVPFRDPDQNFKDRPGIYVDAANQFIQGGRVVPQTQNYLGVGDYATANMLATRDGRALAIPRPPLICSVQPHAGKLRYLGEVVKFSWSGPTFSKVMRITSISPPGPNDTDYEIEMVEDQFATGIRTFGEPGGGFEDPGAGLNTAPPSAAWDEILFPPDGLTVEILETNTGQFQALIRGGISFGSYASGGQYARIYVTEPGGTQTLSPIRLLPDLDNKDELRWPALAIGPYEFCIQTFSLRGATNEVKVCASIEVGEIIGESGSGNFTLPAIQFSGMGSVSVGGGGGFTIP